MATPAELQAQKAPPPPQQPTCVITGLPARYRDPQTRLPYANAAAFKELQRRKAQGMGALNRQLFAAFPQKQQQGRAVY